MKTRLAIALSLCVLPSLAQTFKSGSDGSDGDFILTAPPAGQPEKVVVFDPNDKLLFPNGVNPKHDNIFNFGKITIPANVRVRMRADKLGGPVYWLEQGDVLIQGTVDLNGENGAVGGYVAQTYALPGPGGFYGGGGGDTGARPPSAGFGPQPGVAGNPTKITNNCTDFWAGGGGYTGNAFLVPLIGGSGGGGYFAGAPQIGPSGGAGGGAILIASSGTITIAGTGVITARGGQGAYGGSGAGAGGGGSIRLIANTVTGNGVLGIAGPSQSCPTASGAGGRIRLEAFQNTFNGQTDGDLRAGSPFATFVPDLSSPQVKILSVNGASVNPYPMDLSQCPTLPSTRPPPFRSPSGLTIYLLGR